MYGKRVRARRGANLRPRGSAGGLRATSGRRPGDGRRFPPQGVERVRSLSLPVLLLALVGPLGATPSALQGGPLLLTLHSEKGSVRSLRAGSHRWLSAPPRLSVRDEVTGAIDPSGVRVVQSWSTAPSGLRWDLALSSDRPRRGHEVTIELPVLSRRAQVFTPSERGVMSVAANPTYTPAAYGAYAWGTRRCYVLPLASVLDPAADCGLTIALPADANIPHLQVEWEDSRILRLRLAHRGIGGDEPTRLSVLLFGHAADYRAALAAYAGAFPAYFRPPLPRGEDEGAFYYHHIQASPDAEEMHRQDVRFIWSSFWFPYLGECLPAEPEWAPYTYARWWKLGETMTDSRIRAFCRDTAARGVATYAYLNTTEYGGFGGASGDQSAADVALESRFAAALMRGEDGKPIPTWEGAMAMNPGPGYPFFAHLQEQTRRHLDRLPEIGGFAIDRLDWSSRVDYGHSDGLTMLGDRPVENMAVPVGEAVREVCRLAHAQGKRVWVNQFYRVEVLRDVDGTCHEYDYPRGLSYLSPYRPASAWHADRPYGGDLLEFEAQMKLRLQTALFPQMIAHSFPISQQPADPEAADMLEVYAPLFGPLHQADRVLLPHCIEVTGTNGADLYARPSGQYVVPLLSRTRFLSRPPYCAETATVRLRIPASSGLAWAYVLSAEQAPYWARLAQRRGYVEATADRHSTASVLVVGCGPRPALPQEAASVGEARRRLGIELPVPPVPSGPPVPTPSGVTAELVLTGKHVGIDGPVELRADGLPVGTVTGDVTQVRIASRFGHRAPRISLVAGDEGSWFAPERAELVLRRTDGHAYTIAEWTPTCATEAAPPWTMTLPLRWVAPRPLVRSTAAFVGRDTETGGAYAGRFGRTAAWIPQVTGDGPQAGFALNVSGRPFAWSQASDDPRVLRQGGSGLTPATCWFEDAEVRLQVTPPDGAPYQLTLYVLDYDRNGRSERLSLRDRLGELDSQSVTVDEAGMGVYVSWQVTGPVSAVVAKQAGYNVTLSGVFVDR